LLLFYSFISHSIDPSIGPSISLSNGTSIGSSFGPSFGPSLHCIFGDDASIQIHDQRRE